MNPRRYQFPRSSRWRIIGWFNLAGTWFECKLPTASGNLCRKVSKKGKKMFSKQISIKNFKLFAVNNFVQLRKVLRDLKPWKILTFFFVNKQSRWSFSRKANLFVDLMKSNLIKVYLSFWKGNAALQANENQRQTSAARMQEKNQKENSSLWFVFHVKADKGEFIEALGSNLYGNSISWKTIFRQTRLSKNVMKIPQAMLAMSVNLI